MIKILILSHSSELSGAERSMIDLLDYWVKKAYIEPHLIIRKPLNNMVPELQKRGWNYYPVHYTNWSQRRPSKNAEDVFRNARTNAEAVKTIEKIIKKVKPDLVMTNTIVSPWAAITAYFMRIPHAWFVREYGDIDHQHEFELGRQNMLEDIDTLSDLVITNSKTLAEHVGKYIRTDKIIPLYTPFDLNYLERRSQEEAINPFKQTNSLKLVITGRIAPSKGQDEAAKAVGELAKRGLEAELCIIGQPADPMDLDTLNRVIKEYGIEDRVHLIGQQQNPLAIIKYADVGIMASKQEAFGRVTFEYMATGLPVVGANSGATPELITDSHNGFLYIKGNTKSLVKQLEKYAKNSSLVAKHGREAKKSAQKMMKGKYNAEALFERLKMTLKASNLEEKKPLHFSRRWIMYPLIAQQYIEDSKVISFKKLFKIRLRAKLKSIYITVIGYFDRVKKNY